MPKLSGITRPGSAPGPPARWPPSGLPWWWLRPGVLPPVGAPSRAHAGPVASLSPQSQRAARRVPVLARLCSVTFGHRPHRGGPPGARLRATAAHPGAVARAAVAALGLLRNSAPCSRAPRWAARLRRSALRLVPAARSAQLPRLLRSPLRPRRAWAPVARSWRLRPRWPPARSGRVLRRAAPLLVARLCLLRVGGWVGAGAPVGGLPRLPHGGYCRGLAVLLRA